MISDSLRPARRILLANYLFAGCLVVLVLNDHILKARFGNALTGKLSDIAGIMLLPLLLTWALPRLRTRSIWISAVLFTYWKSPFAQAVIDWYNGWSPLGISRIVDYSDLLVLPLLAVPYLLIADPLRLRRLEIRRLHPVALLCVTVPALMATSPSQEMRQNWYRSGSDGNLKCFDCSVIVKGTEEGLLRDLQQAGIAYRLRNEQELHNGHYLYHSDSIVAHFYQIPQLVIDADTLREIDFSLSRYSDTKTRLQFGGMRASKTWSTIWAERKLRRHYWRMIVRRLAK